MIPAWLQTHLTATGAWNTDGIGRALRARQCTCGARVLSGLDADRAALPAAVEPSPVDPAGELLALMQNRRTFRIRYFGRWEIDRRSSFDIAAQPAGKVDVLIEHECGRPFPCNGPPIRPHRVRIELQEETCPY
ncbi:MAG TPA: hypothetical protein VFR23_25335 [Jiangellaceae bacterium]|nr:hypothetical protein [Jiangellaceae bacterium]